MDPFIWFWWSYLILMVSEWPCLVHLEFLGDHFGTILVIKLGATNPIISGFCNVWAGVWIIFTPFWRHFDVLRHHFGTILVIVGCKGAFRRALECSNIDFYRFLMIFGRPVGVTLGSLFHNSCDLTHQKACLDCRHDSWWCLIGKFLISDTPPFQKRGKYNGFY